MSANQLSLNVEVNLGDIMKSMIEEFGTEEIIDFVDELVEEMADGDFTNELYEVMRRHHENWLDETDVSEQEYREDYADPTLYCDEFEDDEAEIDLSDEEEPWTTDPDQIDDEENPLDVFTTD